MDMRNRGDSKESCIHKPFGGVNGIAVHKIGPYLVKIPEAACRTFNFSPVSGLLGEKGAYVGSAEFAKAVDKRTFPSQDEIRPVLTLIEEGRDVMEQQRRAAQRSAV